jgi:hypothetical protein
MNRAYPIITYHLNGRARSLSPSASWQQVIRYMNRSSSDVPAYLSSSDTVMLATFAPLISYSPSVLWDVVAFDNLAFAMGGKTDTLFVNRESCKV